MVAVAGGSYSLYAWLRPQPLPQQILYGNGHIEGTEIRVAAEVGGRVIKSDLHEGKTVTRGDPLVQLDDAELKLKLARAQAEIDALRGERQRVERELEVWKHHRRVAEVDLARYRELKVTGAATPQRLEQAENEAREARGRVASLSAQIDAAEARIVAARRATDLVQYHLEKTRVVAPISGTVLTKTAEVGEYLQLGGAVAILVDLSRVDLKIYLPEKDIGKLKLDLPARIRVDAFPDRVFAARLAQIDQQAQFTPRDIHMPEERTRMVFGVKLSLDNRERVLKPGMPADAWILWQSEATWPERLFVPQ